MKYDIITCGVGGQGILSISFIIDNSAMSMGYNFKQSEVHGMAQRGGAVSSHIRISDKQIFSDLVPAGSADMILSVEPLETLRYVGYLSYDGIIVASSNPYVNIPDYPQLEEIIDKLESLKNHILVNSEDLARKAGSGKAQNMVMIGAASKRLPLDEQVMKKFIMLLFKAKGEKVQRVNIDAFDFGKIAAENFLAAKDAGMTSFQASVVCGKLEPKPAGTDILDMWLKAIDEDPTLLEKLQAHKKLIPPTIEGFKAFLQ